MYLPCMNLLKARKLLHYCLHKNVNTFFLLWRVNINIQNHRITEYAELKGSLSSTPSPAQDAPKVTLCLKALPKCFLNSVRLVLWPLLWGACSSAQPPSWWKTFSWYPTETSLTQFHAVSSSHVTGNHNKTSSLYKWG